MPVAFSSTTPFGYANQDGLASTLSKRVTTQGYHLGFLTEISEKANWHNSIKINTLRKIRGCSSAVRAGDS
jgi:hypothetical protein